MAREKRTPEENARREKIRELLQMANIGSMDDIQSLFKETIAEFMENGLNAELDDELGYSRYDYKNKDTDNSRNGHSSKTLCTSFGDVEISVPRDRKGEFEPHVLKKNQTSISQDIEEKILPNKEAIHHMEKAITMATLGVVERPVRQGLPLVCVGGTARAALKLAKRVCRLPETSNSITIGQLDRVCQELCASQKQAADLILKIEPERIHTMIPGMLILRHMVQGFGAGRVIVSQYGVREGYLCQKILKAS